jgi:parvulin-like peptidyl-prolyl isomerase
MFVERDTNRLWINQNPTDHISQALTVSKEPALQALYAAQFVTAEAFQLLKKPKKEKADFYAFLSLRQDAIRAYITQRFGFPLTNVAVEEDLDEEEQPSEDGNDAQT